MKTKLILPCLLLVLSILSGKADAHAALVSATPAIDAVVSQSPPQVALSFSEDLEPAFCKVEVSDASGQRRDKGDLHLQPGNPRVLVLSLPPLTPADYVVTWRVTSVDTHKSQGRFGFAVAP